MTADRIPPAHRALRYLRAFGILLSAFALLVVLAWWGVPHLLRHQLEHRASERLGRAVTAGRIDFRPWRLELRMHDLAVAGAAPGVTPQLRIDGVRLRLAWSSVRYLAPVVRTLRIEQPRLRIAHKGEGGFDIDDILARLERAPRDPAAPPVRFSLHDLDLRGGEIDFDDRGRAHAVRELSLRLPLLSSLAAQRETAAEPRLAFTLDGSRFDSSAQATPFASTREGEATLRFEGLDLAPYLSYWPAGLPVRLAGGTLDAELHASFRQAEAPTPANLEIRGQLTAHRPVLQDADGQEVLRVERLAVEVARLRPFAREVAIGQVTLQALQATLRCGSDGRIAGTGRAATATASAADRRTAPAQAATPAASIGRTAPPPWTATVSHFRIAQGRIDWHDATTDPAAALALTGLALDLQGAAWPMKQPARLTASADATGIASGRTTGAGEGTASVARLSVHGTLTPDAVALDIDSGAIPLAWAAPYLSGVLAPTVAGTVTTRAALQWSPAGTVVEAKNLRIADLALVGRAGEGLAGVRRLTLDGARIDTARRSVSLPQVGMSAPRLRLARDARGHWMFEDWRVAADTGRAGTPAGDPAGVEKEVRGTGAAASSSAASATPWSVAVGQLALDEGALQFRDAGRSPSVAVDVSELQLGTGRLRWPLVPGEAPVAVDLSARIGEAQETAPADRGRGTAAADGRTRFRGTVAPSPLVVAGRLEARRVPLQAFEPYFDDLLNVQVARAEVGYTGEVKFAATPPGAQWQLDGDGTVENVRILSAAPDAPATAPVSQARVATAAPSRRGGALSVGAFSRGATSLLGWGNLELRGLSVASVPGSALRVSVNDTVWSDFFARIAIDPDGRSNLLDLVKKPAADAPEKIAGGRDTAPATAPKDAQKPAPVVRVGPVRFVNGRVLFSDRFIRPSYEANLSELTGQLGGFTSAPAAAAEGAGPAMADLGLRGKVEGTASLEVRGKLNPLVQPLVLDIEGKVRDLELPPLSPYAIKYVGHGIERGKLDVDVAYKVQPDGLLTATNALVLRQLVFGEQQGDAKTSLPVKLATALLADRNGVIDLDLPIQGSLNDPQFSLAPVIGKALVNLVARAITSPFSLLSNALGGNASEAATVTFAPGSAEIAGAAEASLAKVAQALVERPALRMTVVGMAHRETEADGLRRERLDQLLRIEKRRSLPADAQGDAPRPALAEMQVAPQERPALLASLYDRTDMPKPRNAIGLARTLPAGEMEKLLMEQIDVTDDTVRSLAVRRGTAVRDYLAAHGVAGDRLFVGAARRVSDADARAGWTPHAELDLSAR
ncbi:DUF748 domain-containing protein [Xylophilus ampelinus]|uniref:Uncharacterized protein DUF748 n=1 Tax=Xylophilus ampelinus TaxID=54067 RepID=A0A318SGY7_9BURK|nr:DUF748 domain-containing protein [Xylophilus ampelinus]MCS4510315.1 DUF748 domain-containing protein [Xylophilus ampelinus]PYE78062.1 uncharacterized protein DUF748 [Xylophilus ampelinus]